jgi:hypothetical protein
MRNLRKVVEPRYGSLDNPTCFAEATARELPARAISVAMSAACDGAQVHVVIVAPVALVRGSPSGSFTSLVFFSVAKEIAAPK